MGVDEVIGLGDGHVLSPRLVKAAVDRGAVAPVGLVDHPHAGIPGLGGAQKLEGAVCRPVVHEDDLYVRKGLAGKALHALLHVALDVVHGNDNAHQGPIRHLPPIVTQRNDITLRTGAWA